MKSIINQLSPFDNAYYKYKILQHDEDRETMLAQVSEIEAKACNPDWWARVSFQGHCCKVARENHNPDQHRPPMPGRGKIRGFSRRSRQRLLEVFHRLDMTELPVFITLTYVSNMQDERAAKAHLRALLERFRRRFAGRQIAGMWRLEYQERGAVHFHLLMFGMPFLPFAELREMWGEIIGENNPRVRIEMARSYRNAAHYLSKYIAKVEQSPSADVSLSLNHICTPDGEIREPGRFWGYFNRKELPFAPETVYTFPAYTEPMAQFRSICALIWERLKDDENYGFVLFTENEVAGLEKRFLALIKDPFGS